NTNKIKCFITFVKSHLTRIYYKLTTRQLLAYYPFTAFSLAVAARKNCCKINDMISESLWGFGGKLCPPVGRCFEGRRAVRRPVYQRQRPGQPSQPEVFQVAASLL